MMFDFFCKNKVCSPLFNAVETLFFIAGLLDVVIVFRNHITYVLPF